MLPQIPNFKCKSFLHNFYNSLLNAYYSSFITGAVLEVVFAWNPYNFAIFIQFYKYKSHPFCFLSACVQSTLLCHKYLSTLCTCLKGISLSLLTPPVIFLGVLLSFVATYWAILLDNGSWLWHGIAQRMAMKHHMTIWQVTHLY